MLQRKENKQETFDELDKEIGKFLVEDQQANDQGDWSVMYKGNESLHCTVLDATLNRIQENQAKGKLQNFINDAELCNNLRQNGIEYLFPIQYATFQIIKKGLDIIGKDRTGSGKTLAYALPVIQRFKENKEFQPKVRGSPIQPKFLIVVPTRQLAIQVAQQIDGLRTKNGPQFRAVAIYGKIDKRIQLQKMNRGAEIIAATPGRLLDFLDSEKISFEKLKVVCLDEADQMLKQGFQDDIQRILNFIGNQQKKRDVQTLLFSATIPPWVRQLSEKYQKSNRMFIDRIKDSKRSQETSTTVKHYKIECHPKQHQELLSKIIRQFGAELQYANQKGSRFQMENSVLIFAETKKDVDHVGRSFKLGTKIKFLHGDVSQDSRQKIYKDFKQGRVRCVVATNVAARGLDFPQIQLVVQLSPPKDTESYIHRSGRTGRAGKSGTCITFYSSEQYYLISRIERDAKIRLNNFQFGKKLKQRIEQAKNPTTVFKKKPRKTEQVQQNQLSILMNSSCQRNGIARFQPAPLQESTIQRGNMKKKPTVFYDDSKFKKPIDLGLQIGKPKQLVKQVPIEIQKKKPTQQSNKLSTEQINRATEKKQRLEVKIENIAFQADSFDMERFFIEEHGIRVAILIQKDKLKPNRSLGFGYGLCINQEYKEKILKLRDISYEGRKLRITNI